MKKIILALAVLMLAVSTLARNENTTRNENTKVYAVFFSLSPDLSNEILSVLENKCEGIEFIGKEIISYDGKGASDYTSHEISIPDKKSNLVLQNIENSQKDLDGLILFFETVANLPA